MSGCLRLSRSRCSETCPIKGVQSAVESAEAMYDQRYSRMTSLWVCVACGAHPALRTSQHNRVLGASRQNESCLQATLLCSQNNLARALPCPLLQPCFCRLLIASHAKCLLLGSAHTAPRMAVLPPKLRKCPL